eukprot:XP_011664040.1 PREDICTED: cytochrome P450 4A14 [Strongylocentrotus purpuratus]
MATLKGKIGYPILGDSSVEFYRNVPLYVNSRIEEYGARIFQARILNKPTVFVCSANAVKELLTEHHTKMDLGYKAMLHHLYGDNIMFEEAAEANRLHALMHHVFIQNALLNFDSIVQKFIQRHFSDLHSRPSVQVMRHSNCLATELMFGAVLDLDVSDSADLVHDGASLATHQLAMEDMQEKARESSDYLDWCLLETERLWPPVLGGRRLVREDFVLDGYKVPKGYAVIYVSSIAHRDPNVFKNPNSFDPTRWANKRTEKEKLLFCYGDGPRCCVGTSLMKNLIKKVSQYLVGHYNWTLGDQEEDLDYKWLPMARPRELSVSFTRIDQSEASSELAGSD